MAYLAICRLVLAEILLPDGSSVNRLWLGWVLCTGTSNSLNADVQSMWTIDCLRKMDDASPVPPTVQNKALPSCAVDILWSKSLHRSDPAAEPRYRVPAYILSCPITTEEDMLMTYNVAPPTRGQSRHFSFNFGDLSGCRCSLYSP